MKAISRPASLLAILRCPSTGEPLREDGLKLVNRSGDRSYPVLAGQIPVLLAGGTVFDVATDDASSVSDRFVARLRSRLRRLLTDNRVSRGNLDDLAGLLKPSAQANGARRRVLVVGGGILGFGMEALTGAPWIDLLETDVYVGPRTQIVCDVHDLPFVDGAFDAVVVQAVLEHVADPQRAVAELHRVLREDGLVYSEVPFMQQVHEGPYDFTRWTLTGHRRLLRGFAEIDAGPLGGAGEALAWSIRYYGLALVGGSPGPRRMIAAALSALTLPLRWTDRLLARRPGTLDAASGTYFLGRRRPTPQSDAEIVARHVGAVPAPTR